MNDNILYHAYIEGADAPKGTFRPYQLSEPQRSGDPLSAGLVAFV